MSESHLIYPNLTWQLTSTALLTQMAPHNINMQNTKSPSLDSRPHFSGPGIEATHHLTPVMPFAHAHNASLAL